VLGLLCGLCCQRRRKFLVYASLTILFSFNLFLAWCSVYPQRPSTYPYTDLLWSFRSLKPSYPFWVGSGPWARIPEQDYRALYFLEYPIVERVWFMESHWMEWNNMVNQEFFTWLAVINVVYGTLGLLVSWKIINVLRGQVRPK
jgi:hypothetical protein